MANLSNYWRDMLLNAAHLVAPTIPGGLFVALCSSTPTASQTGATIPELTNAGGYARFAIAYGVASAGVISNSTATGGASTGAFSAPATAYAICDSGTIGAGNMFFFGPLQGTNDVQTVSTSAQLTAGTYTLNPSATTTVAIPFNATAAQILEYLEAAGGAGNFTVAFAGNRFDQASPSALTITFIGALASASQTLMTLTPSGVTGGTLSIAHTTTGAPGTITVAGTGQTPSIPSTQSTVTLG